MKNMMPAIMLSRILQAILLLNKEDMALAPNPREIKNTKLANDAPMPNPQTSAPLYCNEIIPINTKVSRYTCGLTNVKTNNLTSVCFFPSCSGLYSWVL